MKLLKYRSGLEMKNNYFIIHGSFSSPYSNWIAWLHDFISSDGKQVYVPDFPIGVGYQNYENWSKLLKYYLDLGLINENTTIIAHSIAPVFASKFLTENKVKVKKLIFVCGFNNYLGIDEEYDAVNKSMYFDNLEDIKQYASEIICFYSDNDPYVKYEKEKDFADKIATEQVLLPNAGHINSESGYDTFEDIVSYL
jgi:predicted alpha/beta hydrolase family esterase